MHPRYVSSLGQLGRFAQGLCSRSCCPGSAGRAAGRGSACLYTHGVKATLGDREGSCSIRSPLVSHPPDPAALAGLGYHQG